MREPLNAPVVEADHEAHAANPYSSRCPSRRLLALLGDKWSLLIMPLLSDGPKRNGELMRHVEGISQKMLTQTLRELERNGLIERIDHGEVPPRVEYALSPLGLSLAVVFRGIDRWVEAHFAEVEASRQAYDAKFQAVAQAVKN